MTLRRRKTLEARPRQSAHYQMWPHLKEYIAQVKAIEMEHFEKGGPKPRDQSDIINYALDSWRRLEQGLAQHGDAVEAEAVRLGLDMDEKLADVLVALVKTALSRVDKK